VIVLKKYDDSKVYVIAHADGIRACGTILVYLRVQPPSGQAGTGTWAMVWDPVGKKVKTDVPLNTSTPEHPLYAVFPCLESTISVWKALQGVPDVLGDVITNLTQGGSWHPPEYMNQGHENWDYLSPGSGHATQASNPAGLLMTDVADWTGENNSTPLPFGHQDYGDYDGIVDYTISYGYTVNGCRGNEGLNDVWDGPGNGITATGIVNPYFEISGSAPVIYWDKEVQVGHKRGTGWYARHGVASWGTDSAFIESVIDSFNGPWGKIFDDIVVNDYSNVQHSEGAGDVPTAISGLETTIYQFSLRDFNGYQSGGQQRSAIYSKKYMLHLEYLECIKLTQVVVTSMDAPVSTDSYTRGDVRVSIGSTLCNDTSKVNPLEMERDILFENAFRTFILAIEATAPAGLWQQTASMVGDIGISILGGRGD
jgi:hypothetical protein